MTAAANAQITVGNGPGAFTVTNDSNDINGLMPGVTIDLQEADPGQQTTISLQPDGQTMATTVQTLVTAANQLITDLNTATAFTPGLRDLRRHGRAAARRPDHRGPPQLRARRFERVDRDQQRGFSWCGRHHDGN